jgi:hypothetical protein
MATVNKDFKVKNGLIVEGTTAKVNNFDILTKKQADQDYIVSLIGGTATSANTANTVVKRDADGNFAAGTITANITGNVTGNLTGNVTGTVSDISNHDTDDLTEGTSNKYFTTGRIDDHLSGGDGISYSSGTISADLGTGLEITSGQIVVDRDTVDTWYDAAGSASTVAGNLTTHQTATTGIHGVTGNVVGTSDTQSLSNKTISYADNTITVQVANVSDLTASAAELNLLDGVTATTAELNLLDGVTATTTELNYVDGVTSGIQGQLDDKAPLASPSLTGTPLAPTAAPGTNNTQIATTAYADAAVAAIVDGAPALLNTLNELAAAINDDENFASTLTTLAGEKVAKAGDTMTGLLVLSADPSANLGAATKQYVDAAESDAVTSANSYTDGRETAITTAYQSYADTAEQDAKDYADDLINDASNLSTEVWSAYKTGTEIGLAQQAAIDHADALDTDDIAEGSANLYFTNQRAIDAVSSTITNAINALDTDDIEEGATNLYHTSSRAKSAAAELLTGASLTNITITGTGAGLTITAENGVADSTTTDLAEGTNLYFTNARAVTALEAVVPNFTEVDINSLATQVAATVSVPTASSNNVAYSFAKADYRSAEFLVKTAYSTHTEISKVLLTLDTSDNIAITEYGTIGTNGTAMTISADIDGSNVRLLVTTANNTSTITVVGTLLK